MRARLNALVGLAGVLLALSCAPAPAPPAAERPSGEPLKDFARGVELQRQGEHVRSVPFFRAAAQVASQEAQPHEELAKALHNASIQMGFSGHGVRYAVARSQDRARLRNEALVELDRALELEPDPQQQAALWMIRSRALELSGYVMDARLSLERADALAPHTPVIQAWHERLDRRLQIAH